MCAPHAFSCLSQPSAARDLLGAPALAEQQTSVLLKDADVQNLAAHRPELLTGD
jgi:hypothetical protein